MDIENILKEWSSIKFNGEMPYNKEDVIAFTEHYQSLQLHKTQVSGSFSLKDYQNLDNKVLRKISFLLEKVETAFGYKDDIHEDIQEFMQKPFIEILKHHGVNLSEQSF